MRLSVFSSKNFKTWVSRSDPPTIGECLLSKSDQLIVRNITLSKTKSSILFSSTESLSREIAEQKEKTTDIESAVEKLEKKKVDWQFILHILSN